MVQEQTIITNILGQISPVEPAKGFALLLQSTINQYLRITKDPDTQKAYDEFMNVCSAQYLFTLDQIKKQHKDHL